LPTKADSLKWNGWRAYRRGLITALHELGIPGKVIQAIGRHEDLKTTQRSYIKTAPNMVTEAMKRLEEKIASAADVRHASVS
jgi:integrase